jgi:hypothetical protein
VRASLGLILLRLRLGCCLWSMPLKGNLKVSYWLDWGELIKESVAHLQWHLGCKTIKKIDH